MTPRLYIYAGVAALVAAIFWLGKLQERSVNAPAVARAQAKYDALAGEKKTLETDLQEQSAEVVRLTVALDESEARSRKLKSQVVSKPVLLGVVDGKPVVAMETSTRTSSQESVVKRRQMAVKAQQARKAFKSKSSKLVANRQASRPFYVGGGLHWDKWNDLESLKNGSGEVSLGLNFMPFQAGINKSLVNDGAGIDARFNF